MAADQLEIELQSDGYALCVHLAFNDAKLLLSDNYFDLPGGKRALIEISGSAEVLDGWWRWCCAGDDFAQQPRAAGFAAFFCLYNFSLDMDRQTVYI